ncbi:hypothetical protein SAMN02745883_00684 [Caminicella sporogenes DSM 14501]|uniref:Uncharacterized protein n=1 Tax=Caminicella sporogenes DSM 14501 TaxID=1121266 RepID=A0A1M6MX94_9FIRM|nr:hypothetical protein [Caminicella sporogenes]RKD22461.1 hypothetical protein BET04_05360 [Caminicella sporogenes]SHJ88024.1 hypothetical protein SAMN02745883_00684 [Caminicella sporogenes DSM 14501]
MAWQTPKTDWKATDGVTNADLNRIEENTQVAYDKAVVALNTANSKLGKTEKATDSDKLDGWHRDQIRDWNNLLNKPTHLPANGGNADSVDGLHFREYNGRLQYYYGGKWKDIMVSPIKSIQRGIMVHTVPNTTTSIIINAVDPNKTMVNLLTSSADDKVDSETSIWLENSTTLKIKQHSAAANVSWEVIEFI